MAYSAEKAEMGTLRQLVDNYKECTNQVHCRPEITRMSGSTILDHVISESHYTEVFYYVTNGMQS